MCSYAPCAICVAVIDVLALVIAVSFSSVTYLQTQDNIICKKDRANRTEIML